MEVGMTDRFLIKFKNTGNIRLTNPRVVVGVDPGLVISQATDGHVVQQDGTLMPPPNLSGEE